MCCPMVNMAASIIAEGNGSPKQVRFQSQSSNEHTNKAALRLHQPRDTPHSGAYSQVQKHAHSKYVHACINTHMQNMQSWL